MSLMTAKDAVPWGESIRTELIAGHMPPWSVDAAPGRFKNVPDADRPGAERAADLGDGRQSGRQPGTRAAAVTLHSDAHLGTPDLELPLSEVTLPAETPERTQEVSLPTAAWSSRWVRAVDFVPGTPAVVRSATIFVKPTAAADPDRGAIAPERVLAVWVPGDDPVALDGAAFHLPAGAEIGVRVHYKKTWENQRTPMTDRSSVRVYFAAGPAPELRALTLSIVAPDPRSPDCRSRNDCRSAESSTRICRRWPCIPTAAWPNVDVIVEAIRPDGSHIELIRFRPQPDWARRYWFERPISLPRGSRIEAVATFADALLPPGAAPAKRATHRRWADAECDRETKGKRQNGCKGANSELRRLPNCARSVETRR